MVPLKSVGQGWQSLLLSAGKFMIKRSLLGVPASFQCQTWWWCQGLTIPTTNYIFERSLLYPIGIAIPVSHWDCWWGQCVTRGCLVLAVPFGAPAATRAWRGAQER